MTDSTTPDERAVWQRRLAAQANNRAWRLSEMRGREAQEDEEMRHAAHASAYLWGIVGDASNRAFASLLLAHVYALLDMPAEATRFFEQCESFFGHSERAAWETACACAVRASVAASAGDHELHAKTYREAERLIAALPDPQDRAILGATLNVVRRPGA